MRLFPLVFLFCFLMSGVLRAENPKLPAQPALSFKLSQTEVPKSLDPHRSRSSSGQFLSQQLYRNFYTYDDKKSYVPELGESCKKVALKWTCKLKSDLKWSDGSAITALDFVLSIRRAITLPSPRADLLFNLKNAQAVFEQKMTPDKLGVKVIDSLTFELQWNEASPDNDLVLMSPLFVPLPEGLFKKSVFSGPYQLSDQSNQRLLLSPNRLYFKKNSRPPVEFQIYEENLAVKAFEKKQLDFLRRIPTAQIPLFKNRPDFHWQPVLRLDSIAFGPELKNQAQLRKQLAESLNFDELQTLFHSPGRIGCPGLPEKTAKAICYKGNPRNLVSKLEKSASPELTFAFSSLGGDDHRRLAEWLQSQWQKNLNLKLSIQPLENKIFQSLLETKPPALFRKGLNLEVPSCASALSLFTTGHPDNFIGFENKKYDQVVSKLVVASEKKKRQLCTQALQILMDSYVLIPTGRIHFAVMVNPAWTGWRLNELNHLDLSELRPLP